MADNLPELAWMADRDGWIYWYNRSWYDYTGATPEQMEGWGWQSVHDPVLLPEVMDRWKRSLATGKPFEMTFPLRGADGVFRPFLTRIRPLRDSSGAISNWFGVNTEVADLHRVAEKLAEQKRVAETLNRTATQVAAELNLAASCRSSPTPQSRLRTPSSARSSTTS
jgi:PAS domain S-box-containing protein